MSNTSYDTEIYSRGTTINDLFDNYLLFIHNIQIQQSNLLTLNSNIHNSLYNLINTTISNNEQRIHYNNRNVQNRRQSFLNRGRSNYPINISRQNNISNSNILNANSNSISNPINLTSLHPSLSSFLSSPVRVYPSTEQINNSTHISLYSDLREQHNNICPIRNEEFRDNDIVIQINHCGHTFFPNEFYGWFRDHVQCPMCRYDIREDISLNNVDQSNNSLNNNSSNLQSSQMQSSQMQSSQMQSPTIDISSSVFIFDLSNNLPSVSSLQSRQFDSLTQLTQTMARELVSQLNNEINTDLSSSEIELALSFVNTNNSTENSDMNNID